MATRNKVTGVYPRGEETRARILDVAIQLFGLHGFDGVTTRMIATAASVPAPSLRYYFENKDGLYLACWDHIQGQLLDVMDAPLQAAERLLAEEAPDRMRLIDAFCTMQEALFDHMVGRPKSAAIALFVARIDLPAAGRAKNLPVGAGAIAHRMLASFTQIVLRVSGNTLDWQGALIVAGLANGQLATIYAKRSGLAEMGIELADERLSWLKRTIRQHTVAIFLLHSG